MKFDSKVCAARRPTAARIWIEGKRLREAGWRRGDAFVISWQFRACGLMKCTARQAQLWGLKPRHVAGTVERPIIDVTGEIVAQTFGPAGTPLVVEFQHDVIAVRRA